MTQLSRWSPEDADRCRIINASGWYEWLRTGLADWADPQKLWKAFDPIGGRFDGNDDAEPQLASFYIVMSDTQKQNFLNAIGLGFTQAETTDVGASLFNSLQRLTRLIGDPAPTAAMASRICDTNYLDQLPQAFAEHLFANSFLTLAEIPQSEQRLAMITRLERAKHFKPAYRPYVADLKQGKAPTPTP